VSEAEAEALSSSPKDRALQFLGLAPTSAAGTGALHPTSAKPTDAAPDTVDTLPRRSPRTGTTHPPHDRKVAVTASLTSHSTPHTAADGAAEAVATFASASTISAAAASPAATEIGVGVGSSTLPRGGGAKPITLGGTSVLDGGSHGMSVMIARVRSMSPLISKAVGEIRFRGNYGVTIVAIERPNTEAMQALGTKGQADATPGVPAPRMPRRVREVRVDTTLHANDLLYLFGQPEDVKRLVQKPELALMATGRTTWLPPPVLLAEFLVPHTSTAVGLTIKETGIERRYTAVVVAVMHDGLRLVGRDLAEIRLAQGDVVLVSGHRRNLGRLASAAASMDAAQVVFLASYPNNVINVSHTLGRRQLELWRIVLVGAVLLALAVVMAGGWVPNALAVLGAAVVLVAFGCLPAAEAYHAIDWETVVVTAAMLAHVQSLDKHGLIQAVARGIASVDATSGPYAVLAVLYVIAAGLGVTVGAATAAVLAAPVAYAAAAVLALDARAFLVAVAVGAATAFLRPSASPAVQMVYGLGQYRLTEHLLVGAVLAAVLFSLALALAPVLFPFTYIDYLRPAVEWGWG